MEIDQKALEAAREAWLGGGKTPDLVIAIKTYLRNLPPPSQPEDDLVAVAWRWRYVGTPPIDWLVGREIPGDTAPGWEIEPLYSAETVSRLTRERDEYHRDAEHFSDLAFVDVGANPPVSWKARAEAAEAESARLREALKPFADVGRLFSWSVGPDGIDDGMTVIIEPVARREWAAHLSTADFSRAVAALSGEHHGKR